MKRTKRERRVVEVSQGVAFARRRTDEVNFPASRLALVLIVFLATATGCYSPFARDAGRGRYLDGSDAAADWERARMENPKGRDEATSGESSRAEIRPVAYTARGAVKDVSSDDEYSEESPKTWAEKTFGAIRFPFSSKRATELNSDAEPYGADLRRDGGRVSNPATNDENLRARESTGFWDRLFPSRRPAADEDDQLLLRSRSYDSQTRAEGTESQYHGVSRDAGGAGTPRFARGRTRGSRKVDSWKEIERYDQSRYFPPMKLIEKYYSSRSVPVDRRAVARIDSYAYGDAATRDTTASLASRRAAALNPPESQKTPSASSRGYHSNSYAPLQTPDEGAADASGGLPASPVGSRSGYLSSRGGASLSPIESEQKRVGANKISQRGGVARASGLGKTRPIASDVAIDGASRVAAASFLEPLSAGVFSREIRLAPESLFGWNDETAAALETIDVSADGGRGETGDRSEDETEEIDDSFRESLGSRTSFEWFSPKASTKADVLPIESENRVEKLPLEKSLSQESNEESLAVRLSKSDEISVIDQKPCEDSARQAAERPELEATRENKETSEPEASSTGNLFNNSAEIDDVVDGVIAAPSSFPEPEHGVFSNSTVSGGAIASDLADAIMESVSSNEPLASKASELCESAPESLASRKAPTASAAPLTREEVVWIEQVKNAINSLLQEREEHKRLGDDSRVCDARLRLLYLVIGEYERSIQEIQDESDPLRIFWEKECRGLETLLQNQLEEVDPAFVAERLRSGLDSFSALCNLSIRKLLLVEAPACYGLYRERTDPYEPGEALYAYSELDYATSRESDSGFSIDVECRWRLLNSDGTPRTPFETQRCSNASETKLRDVVLNVSVPLPNDLPPGDYLFELEVTDLNASKPEPRVQRLSVRVVATPLSDSNESRVQTTL